MCGKFKQKLDLEALAALLRLPIEPVGAPPVEEVTATAGKKAWAITGSADKAVLQTMRFGFASAPGMGVRPVINARGETMHEKPLFRTAFASRRCLIPAQAFMEQGEVVRVVHAETFCLAGLWQEGEDGIFECVVITRAALPPVARFHDRMPLVLADTAAARDWLMRAQMPGEPAELTCQEKTPPAGKGQMALF